MPKREQTSGTGELSAFHRSYTAALEQSTRQMQARLNREAAALRPLVEEYEPKLLAALQLREALVLSGGGHVGML